MTNRPSLHAASFTPERFQAAPESTAWTAAFTHNSRARPARSLTGACFDAVEFIFIAACGYAPPRFDARLSPDAGELASGLLWRFARAGLSPAGRLALLWALGLFQAMIAAVSDEVVNVNVIVTVGRTQDPMALGPQSPNVHVERYIPQTLVLPYCDMVITHGGYNTVMGALSVGLPMVVVPIAADQPDNAARCAALGVGRVVQPFERTTHAIGAAAREVLGQAMYLDNARRVRDEIRRLPDLQRGVALLERLADEKAPQTRSRVFGIGPSGMERTRGKPAQPPL